MSKKYTSTEINITEHTDRNINGSLAVVEPATVINSPGLNRRIVVTSFILCNAESQGAITLELQDGGHTHWTFYASAGAVLSKDFPANHPWKLSNNQPLTIDKNAANTVYYSIQYHVEGA